MGKGVTQARRFAGALQDQASSPSLLPLACSPAQVGHMSWGQRFEVINYQAYDIGETHRRFDLVMQLLSHHVVPSLSSVCALATACPAATCGAIGAPLRSLGRVALRRTTTPPIPTTPLQCAAPRCLDRACCRTHTSTCSPPTSARDSR